MYKSIRYIKNFSNQNAAIRIEYDTETVFVPLDPANSDYQNIMRLVEEGKLTIEPADGNNE